ncbi:hypothetical protein Geob_3184 [Geotalea daltonii FRC-32]|uniref:Helicase HerA central domain-containing protein n=1 Tax=Geotalea daltonii (strain DSM 22248 / JCM 15807 / FRC-32) TaxID=316067 RepID=B9M472_GEODF|nr:DUF87 domain-containing protein [Geotalea daltonii]ACM21527.1 hypothetical protein Geob_3184 [Geotalea daltonii FRC-32]
MRQPALSQKTRLCLLLIEFCILCLASQIAFGRVFPPDGEKGFWFYTALLGLILGSRLDTPFYAKPADVVLYAAPAAIALTLGSAWSKWNSDIKVAFVVALAFCVMAGVLGVVAILAKDTTMPRLSNAARVLAETLGAPRTIYTVVVAFALYAFHFETPKEFAAISSAWILTALISPIEASVRIGRRIRRIFMPNTILDFDGEVVAYQTPGLILVRQSPTTRLSIGDLMVVHDPLGKSRIALALDHVGRDEGILLRTIEIAGLELPSCLGERISGLEDNAIVRVESSDLATTEAELLVTKEAIVGLVATDTSVETLFFEVVKDKGLEEGRLVEVKIADLTVTYQLVNGLTKEEIVQQKNTHGIVRAQAQKIGHWDSERRCFNPAKWLPKPNSPVFLKHSNEFQPCTTAVGHFPGTDYPVAIRSISDLVTHNTAILGILGVGKSMLAIELVERMLTEGVKVICIDLTNQYATELAPYFDAATERANIENLQQIGQNGRTRVHQNVEQGGSRQAFSAELATDIATFLNPDTPCRLKIYNPSQFEVWRQDSRPFNNTASMASLSPAEITHIISDSTLAAVSALGMTDRARVCLVYEEAHSLVPEWSSAVAEGDRTAANGSARAILQGRKYGLGCLVITQRTANVSKTVLNQCNTVFAMRTFDETGKEFLANYVGKDYARSLSSLPERHAVLFGKASSCENPILIRLNDRDKFIEVFRTDHTEN